MNIPADHSRRHVVALGYAKEGDNHPTPKPRKEGRVIRWEVLRNERTNLFEN